MTKLSVIIPIYNTPRELLEHCLSSIKENVSNTEGVEILCINDGSTVPYVEQMLKEIEEADNRFKYIFKPNSGVSNTRNMGIDMAQGEYITFVDADDYLEKDALAYMMESAKKRNAEMIVFGFCSGEKQATKMKVNKWISDYSRLEAISSLIENNMKSWYKIGVNLASVWAIIYRRETIIRNKIRFCQIIAPNEDGFFNLYYVQAIDKFYIDNRLVYHYVINEDSAIHRLSNRLLSVAISIIPMLDSFVKNNYPDNIQYLDAISLRAYMYIRHIKETYFVHPRNTKSFWELRSEMSEFLNNPTIAKWIKRLKLFDAEDKIDFKNRLLLKLHIYWLFLITERKKKR